MEARGEGMGPGDARMTGPPLPEDAMEIDDMPPAPNVRADAMDWGNAGGDEGMAGGTEMEDVMADDYFNKLWSALFEAYQQGHAPELSDVLYVDTPGTTPRRCTFCDTGGGGFFLKCCKPGCEQLIHPRCALENLHALGGAPGRETDTLQVCCSSCEEPVKVCLCMRLQSDCRDDVIRFHCITCGNWYHGQPCLTDDEEERFEKLKTCPRCVEGRTTEEDKARHRRSAAIRAIYEGLHERVSLYATDVCEVERLEANALEWPKLSKLKARLQDHAKPPSPLQLDVLARYLLARVDVYETRAMVWKENILNVLYKDEAVMGLQGQWTVADPRETMGKDVAAIRRQNFVPWEPSELLDLKVLAKVLKWVQRASKAFQTIATATTGQTDTVIPFQIRGSDLESLTGGSNWPQFGEGAGVRKYGPLINYVASLRPKYDEWVAQVDHLGRTVTQSDTDALAMLDSLKKRYESLGVLSPKRAKELDRIREQSQSWVLERDGLLRMCGYDGNTSDNPRIQDPSLLHEAAKMAQELVERGGKPGVVTRSQDLEVVKVLCPWLQAWNKVKMKVDEEIDMKEEELVALKDLITKTEGVVRAKGILCEAGLSQWLEEELPSKVWWGKVRRCREMGVSKDEVLTLKTLPGAQCEAAEFKTLIDGVMREEQVERKLLEMAGAIMEGKEEQFDSLCQCARSWFEPDLMKDPRKTFTLVWKVGEEAQPPVPHFSQDSHRITTRQQIVFLTNLRQLLSASYLPLVAANAKVRRCEEELRWYENAWKLASESPNDAVKAKVLLEAKRRRTPWQMLSDGSLEGLVTKLKDIASSDGNESKTDSPPWRLLQEETPRTTSAASSSSSSSSSPLPQPPLQRDASNPAAALDNIQLAGQQRPTQGRSGPSSEVMETIRHLFNPRRQGGGGGSNGDAGGGGGSGGPNGGGGGGSAEGGGGAHGIGSGGGGPLNGGNLVVINDGWRKFVVEPGAEDLAISSICRVTEKAWKLWETSGVPDIDSKKGALEFMAKVSLWLEKSVYEVHQGDANQQPSSLDLAKVYRERAKYPLAIWERLLTDEDLRLVLHPTMPEAIRASLQALGVSIRVLSQGTEANLNVASILENGQMDWPSGIEVHVQGRVTCPVLLSAMGMYWLALTMDCRARCWDRTVDAIIATSQVTKEDWLSREEVYLLVDLAVNDVCLPQARRRLADLLDAAEPQPLTKLLKEDGGRVHFSKNPNKRGVIVIARDGSRNVMCRETMRKERSEKSVVRRKKAMEEVEEEEEEGDREKRKKKKKKRKEEGEPGGGGGKAEPPAMARMKSVRDEGQAGPQKEVSNKKEEGMMEEKKGGGETVKDDRLLKSLEGFKKKLKKMAKDKITGQPSSKPPVPSPKASTSKNKKAPPPSLARAGSSSSTHPPKPASAAAASSFSSSDHPLKSKQKQELRKKAAEAGPGGKCRKTSATTTSAPASVPEPEPPKRAMCIVCGRPAMSSLDDNFCTEKCLLKRTVGLGVDASGGGGGEAAHQAWLPRSDTLLTQLLKLRSALSYQWLLQSLDQPTVGSPRPAAGGGLGGGGGGVVRGLNGGSAGGGGISFSLPKATPYNYVNEGNESTSVYKVRFGRDLLPVDYIPGQRLPRLPDAKAPSDETHRGTNIQKLRAILEADVKEGEERSGRLCRPLSTKAHVIASDVEKRLYELVMTKNEKAGGQVDYRELKSGEKVPKELLLRNLRARSFLKDGVHGKRRREQLVNDEGEVGAVEKLLSELETDWQKAQAEKEAMEKHAREVAFRSRLIEPVRGPGMRKNQSSQDSVSSPSPTRRASRPSAASTNGPDSGGGGGQVLDMGPLYSLVGKGTSNGMQAKAASQGTAASKVPPVVLAPAPSRPPPLPPPAPSLLFQEPSPSPPPAPLQPSSTEGKDQEVLSLRLNDSMVSFSDMPSSSDLLYHDLDVPPELPTFGQDGGGQQEQLQEDDSTHGNDSGQAQQQLDDLRSDERFPDGFFLTAVRELQTANQIVQVTAATKARSVNIWRVLGSVLREGGTPHSVEQVLNFLDECFACHPYHHCLVIDSVESPNTPEFEALRERALSKPVKLEVEGKPKINIHLLHDSHFQRTRVATRTREQLNLPEKTDFLHLIIFERHRSVERHLSRSGSGGSFVAPPLTYNLSRSGSGGSFVAPRQSRAGEGVGAAVPEPYVYGEEQARRAKPPPSQQWGAGKRRAPGSEGGGGMVIRPQTSQPQPQGQTTPVFVKVKQEKIDTLLGTGGGRKEGGTPPHCPHIDLTPRTTGPPPLPPRSPPPLPVLEREEEEEVDEELQDKMTKLLEFMKNSSKTLEQVQTAVRNTMKRGTDKGPSAQFTLEGEKGYKTFMKRYREQQEKLAKDGLMVVKTFACEIAPDAPRSRRINESAVGGGGRGIGRGRGRGRGRGDGGGRGGGGRGGVPDGPPLSPHPFPQGPAYMDPDYQHGPDMDRMYQAGAPVPPAEPNFYHDAGPPEPDIQYYEPPGGQYCNQPSEIHYYNNNPPDMDRDHHHDHPSPPLPPPGMDPNYGQPPPAAAAGMDPNYGHGHPPPPPAPGMDPNYGQPPPPPGMDPNYCQPPPPPPGMDPNYHLGQPLPPPPEAGCYHGTEGLDPNAHLAHRRSRSRSPSPGRPEKRYRPQDWGPGSGDGW